jgi:hypothetical protein
MGSPSYHLQSAGVLSAAIIAGERVSLSWGGHLLLSHPSCCDVSGSWLGFHASPDVWFGRVGSHVSSRAIGLL